MDLPGIFDGSPHIRFDAGYTDGTVARVACARHVRHTPIPSIFKLALGLTLNYK